MSSQLGFNVLLKHGGIDPGVWLADKIRREAVAYFIRGPDILQVYQYGSALDTELEVEAGLLKLEEIKLERFRKCFQG